MKSSFWDVKSFYGQFSIIFWWLSLVSSSDVEKNFKILWTDFSEISFHLFYVRKKLLNSHYYRKLTLSQNFSEIIEYRFFLSVFKRWYWIFEEGRELLFKEFIFSFPNSSLMTKEILTRFVNECNEVNGSYEWSNWSSLKNVLDFRVLFWYFFMYSTIFRFCKDFSP